MKKKFDKDDLFINTLKLYPTNEFKIYNGNIYHNNKNHQDVLRMENGAISIDEMNVNRTSNLIYPFFVKGSSRYSPKSVDTSDYNSGTPGTIYTGSYPLSASIDFTYFTSTTRPEIYSLKNTLNYNQRLSHHFAFSSSLGNKETQDIALVNVPALFYGSSIKKGTVELGYYLSGSLKGLIKDTRQNGELVEVSGNNPGQVAGVVLYSEGVVLLTGSWALEGGYAASYGVPSWKTFGKVDANKVDYVSYTFNFNGVQNHQVLTMFAHADRGEINYSTNPTFISASQTETFMSSSTNYYERNNILFKNTVSSSYVEPTGSYERQVWISKIGIYDDEKNLIAIAKLAKPVKKTENRELTFKLKLDLC
jgi:hypothetical protein